LNGYATTGDAASVIPGCSPADIEISNYKVGFLSDAFQAKCKGNRIRAQWTWMVVHSARLTIE
jgi:hypothetical protein